MNKMLGIRKACAKYYMYVPYIVYLIYMIWIHRNIVPFGDDFLYGEQLDKMSLYAATKYYYTVWGGRIIPTVFAFICTWIPHILWKVANIIIGAAMPVYMYRVAVSISGCENSITEEFSTFVRTVIVVLLMFIPTSVTGLSITWTVGSVYYLWPVMAMPIALYPFVRLAEGKDCSRADWILAYIANMLSSYDEQTGVVHIILAVILLGYIRIKYKRTIKCGGLLGILGIEVINFILMLIAPGSASRAMAEELKWYPGFNMYSFLDQLVMGLIHFLKELYSEGIYILIALVLAMGIIAYKRGRSYQFGHVFLCLMLFLSKDVIGHMEDAAFVGVYALRDLFRLAIVGFTIVYMACLIYVIVDDVYIGIVTTLMFLASIGSAMVIGMSPSVYASGYRVYLFTYMILCVLVGILSLLIKNVLDMRNI